MDPRAPGPPELTDCVARELEPEEKLIWVGQQRLDLAVRSALPAVLLGIVFMGIPVVILLFACLKSDFGGADFVGVACMLPHLVIGIMLVTSPIWARITARRTIYALTDRRAFIWRPGWFGGIVVQSFKAPGFGQMSRVERSDGAGNLIFASYEERDGAKQELGFMGIDDVRLVEDLVRRTLDVGR